MDPSIYTQYSPSTGVPNELPQESKLSTYMNRTPSTPSRPLTHSMSKLSLEPDRQVMINEFIPMSYYQHSTLPEPPENPPVPAMAVHMALPTTQVHQENVGGTTYFYSTTTANALNVSGLNSSASMVYPPGPEACLSSGMGAQGASPYATQMYAGTPAHLGQININPVPTWQAVPMANLVSMPMGYTQPAAYPCNDYRCGSAKSPEYEPSSRFHPLYSPRSDTLTQDFDTNQTPDFTGSLAASFYQPNTIKKEIYIRNDDAFQQADPCKYPDLPQNVGMYTNLIPLEPASPHSLATSFRATHRKTGVIYALRRLHSYPTIPSERLDMWKHVDNSNTVKFYEYFTTQAFGDHSLILVYAYHPKAVTLMEKFLAGGVSATDSNAFLDPFSSDPDAPRPYSHQKNAMLRAVACGALIPEAVLWSILLQLSAALRDLHGAGIACRSVDVTKVVMNGPRVRIAWGGAADAILANVNDLHQEQQGDLNALGQLLLTLACRTIHCDNLTASMDLISRTYSTDFKNLMSHLLTPTNRRDVNDLMPIIGARYYTQIEALQRRADVFEDLLSHEVDNSRLLRILVKLGIVNERPELRMDPSWAETGDRYLLKLFRDHLFHGVTADGSPWFDLAHLTAALNKLDGGVDEKVELSSRDEQSVLVVTYGELKHCLESAFDEVTSQSARPHQLPSDLLFE